MLLEIKKIYDKGVFYMPYNQWVKFNICPKFCDIQIKSVVLKLGKFHEDGNKDKEINKVEIDDMIINAGSTGIICSCGREADEGVTEGYFEIYDVNTNKVITEIYWECPGDKRENSFLFTEPPEEYLICEYGANLYKGALGNISIKITKLK